MRPLCHHFARSPPPPTTFAAPSLPNIFHAPLVVCLQAVEFKHACISFLQDAAAYDQTKQLSLELRKEVAAHMQHNRPSNDTNCAVS